MSSTTFTPVYVAAKKLSTTGHSYTVTLRQDTVTTYAPNENPRFNLVNDLLQVTERQVQGKRTTNVSLPLEMGEAIEVGKEYHGHIRRIMHTTPQWNGHTPAYEGGYATTAWHPAYIEDLDTRP